MQLDECEVAGRKLVVARSDPKTLLDPIEEPLDPLAIAAEIRAEANRIVAIAFRWNFWSSVKKPN